MAAQTKDIKIIRYGEPEGNVRLSQPMSANAACYQGTIALTRGGYAIPAITVASTDLCWGVYNGIKDSINAVSTPITETTVAGTTRIGIDMGTFYFASSTGADAITQANVGATVYVVNETTVALTGSGRPVAGVVAEIGVSQYAGLVAVTMGSAQSTGAI